MMLEIKTYKPDEIAEWFGIKPRTFSNNRAKKLKELEQYCKFEDLGRKGIKVLDVYIPEFVKAPSARSVIEEHFDEGWGSNGYNLNTCVKASATLYDEYGNETKVTASTFYNATCLVKNKFYGSCLKSSKNRVGEKGTSCFVLCLIDKDTGHFRPFTPEEEKIKKDIYAKHFKDYQEQLIEELFTIQHAYKTGIITQQQYEAELAEISSNNYNVNWNIIKSEIMAATSCVCTIATKIFPCAFNMKD